MMNMRFKNILFLCGILCGAQLFSAGESAILGALNEKRRSVSEWFGAEELPCVQVVYPLPGGKVEVGIVRGDLKRVPLYRGDENTGWRTLRYIRIVFDPRGFRINQESLDNGYAQLIESFNFKVTEDAEFVLLPIMLAKSSELPVQPVNLYKSTYNPWS